MFRLKWLWVKFHFSFTATVLFVSFCVISNYPPLLFMFVIPTNKEFKVCQQAWVYLALALDAVCQVFKASLGSV